VSPPIRVALLGYGLAGAVFHAPLIASVEGLELAAIVTHDEERRARARRDHPNAALLGSPEEVWERVGELDFVVVAAAHVLGTVFSEGILAYRVASGALPGAYRHIQDVGPSYVVVGALAAGIAYGPWPGRLACAAGLAVVAPSLFGGLFQLEVSAVGHVSAILVALAVGGGFALARRAAVPRPVADSR